MRPTGDGASASTVRAGYARGESGDGEADATESRERLECTVCMAAPRTCLYLPCAHLVECKACDSRIEQDNGPCPICGVVIDRRVDDVRLP